MPNTIHEYHMSELRNLSVDFLDDQEITEVLDNLAHMIGRRLQDYLGNEYSIFAMIQEVMNRDPKQINAKFLPPMSILLKKMDRLENHAFYGICRELKNGQRLEDYGRRTLLSFLKEHFSKHRSPKASKTKPHVMNGIIRQRRKNESDTWNTDIR